MGNCSLGMCGGFQAGRFWQKKVLVHSIIKNGCTYWDTPSIFYFIEAL